MRSTLPHRWPWLVGSVVGWVLLQGEVTVGNVLGGAVVATLVLAAVPVLPPDRAHRVHPVALARFVAAVLASLVTSSIGVVATALAPSPRRLRSGIVRCRLPGASPLVTTMVADAITLTPGTLTLAAEVDDGGAVLHVHVLGLDDVDAFRAGVAVLHRRATAAVTPLPARHRATTDEVAP